MRKLYYLLILVFIFSCKNEHDDPEHILTIFSFNDVHASLQNFDKLAHLITEAEEEGDVLVFSAGDLFSGNPIVDNHPQKGFPLIDIMNRIGVDAAVFGNHEFDYGEQVLADRMEQSEFPWICANVDASKSVIPQPAPYHVFEIEGYRIAVLGFVETNGKPGSYIPSTHPWRVQNLSFEPYYDVINDYNNIKVIDDIDFIIGLNHLGKWVDLELANEYNMFDLILSGHSHVLLNTMINDTPVLQAKQSMAYVAQAKYGINDEGFSFINTSVIDLSETSDFNVNISLLIDSYESNTSFDEVIGTSGIFHPKGETVGCFYTDALRVAMDVDIAIQNTGGVRSDLDEGPITKREIYSISPFNNGTVIYNLSVGELEYLFKHMNQAFYYSGVSIVQEGDEVVVMDENGQSLPDEQILSLGVNDYVPAVFDDLFPDEKDIQELTAAETLIKYLETTNEVIIYEGCDRFFKFTN